MVKIAIDAMGGDYAPREQVLGAVAALKKDKDLSVILCGDETQIKEVLSECKYDASRVEIGKSASSGKANPKACCKSLKSIEVISATLAE